MTSKRTAWLSSVLLLGIVVACDDTGLNNVGNTPWLAGAGGDPANQGGEGENGGAEDDGLAGGEPAGGGGASAGAGGASAGDFGGSAFGGSSGASFGGSAFGGTAGGSAFGGTSFGGTAGGPSFGGTSFGGTSGAGGVFGGSGDGPIGGSGGTSGNSPGCYAPFSVFAPDDQLDLGPQNTVLLDAHIASGDLRNSADQLVFPNSSAIWEAYANFPATTQELASKTDISLPAELTTVPSNLAQLYVTRRSCAGLLAAARKIKVEVWWRPAAPRATMPTHGVALGVIRDGTTTWLADATKSFVVGDPDAERVMDTLNRTILQHTFQFGDTVNSRDIVVGAWALDTQVFATNFYVGNVEWEE